MLSQNNQWNFVEVAVAVRVLVAVAVAVRVLVLVAVAVRVLVGIGVLVRVGVAVIYGFWMRGKYCFLVREGFSPNVGRMTNAKPRRTTNNPILFFIIHLSGLIPVNAGLIRMLVYFGQTLPGYGGLTG